MAGKEVREYTNLSDPKDRKWGKGKDKIDDEDITFQRMVAKMQEVAGERGGYLHGRGALDSDDLLYLKEQMEAEEDAEPASLADSSPAPLPLPLRVEPKSKSGIRQQDLLKNIVGIKPKRQKVSSPGSLQPEHSTQPLPGRVASPADSEGKLGKNPSPTRPSETQKGSCLVAAVRVHKKQEEQEGKDPSMKSKGAIFTTDPMPMRCSTTTASPGLHSPFRTADFIAASRITSVDSASVALAEPSASTGINPRYTRLCLAGLSSLIAQSNESVVSTGTTTERIGTAGRYLATSLAVVPPRVKTTMSAAFALFAMRTAEDARLSNGLIGRGVVLIISLKMAP
ncbi:hypothetical protein MUK42_18121 [Musa troglodytarum]|uniref:Uncharacterized protein n=1 Tax=Musa troglodytarum TaxID=320322 RepID=A0A9E7H6X4_9LILI|nr:hypothetical protein MUK42_18121 [Musa troglodytarum]